MQKLIGILSLRRAHDSAGEQLFIDTYLKDATEFLDSKGDPIAYVIEVKSDINKVLWSCHIDTMHRLPKIGESDRTHQEVFLDTLGTAFVMDTEDCLGADDGAGAWLMLEMIDAQVPGTYIFHRGEEIGCWGSKRMATLHTEWLEQFTHAVAFDRRGTTSAITHQLGGRCASNLFASQLCALVNMEHTLDPTGVYTDTAEYMSIIPECMNFSVGYQGEHFSGETLDTEYLLKLRDQLITADWTQVFVVDRKPDVKGWYDYDSTPMRIEDIVNSDFSTVIDWVYETDAESVAHTIREMALRIDELESQTSQYEDSYFDTHPYAFS